MGDQRLQKGSELASLAVKWNQTAQKYMTRYSTTAAKHLIKQTRQSQAGKAAADSVIGL